MPAAVVSVCWLGVGVGVGAECWCCLAIREFSGRYSREKKKHSNRRRLLLAFCCLLHSFRSSWDILLKPVYPYIPSWYKESRRAHRLNRHQRECMSLLPTKHTHTCRQTLCDAQPHSVLLCLRVWSVGRANACIRYYTSTLNLWGYRKYSETSRQRTAYLRDTAAAHPLLKSTTPVETIRPCPV